MTTLRTWNAQAYARWYDDPRGRAVERMERQALRRAIPSETAGPLLDIGCGDGRFTTAIVTDGRLTVGLDPSEGMLSAASARTKTEGVPVMWVQGKGERLPLRNEHFGVVLLHLVLAFTEAPERVLSEAFRVLRPGGSLVVAERRKDKSPSGHKFTAALRQAGFDLRHKFGVVHAPLTFSSGLAWYLIEKLEPLRRKLPGYPAAVTYYTAVKPSGLEAQGTIST